MRRGASAKPFGLACLLALAVLAAACAGAPRAAPGASGAAAPHPPSSQLPMAHRSTLAKPFGLLSCQLEPAVGVRFCPGGFVGGKDLRVRSFDGVPISADVTLPPAGSGPWPIVVMLNGLGLSKKEFEGPGPLQNEAFAKQGYAVLTYTARGFGGSCGAASSRTAACARGWIRLADQRYEVRDAQYLAGMLVDEGIAEPAIAVTGVSYGAGQALELAILDNRVRRRDGALVEWTSPRRHIPMRVAATFAQWAWSDLATALVPNGSTSTSSFVSPARATAPFGVEKQSWVSALYLVTKANFLAPVGKVASADLTRWYGEISAGEPYAHSLSKVLDELWQYKSALGIPLPEGGPGAIMIQNGFTDTLFPASQAIQVEARFAAAHVHSPLLLLLDDVGHGWAQDKPADLERVAATATRFLDDVMLAHRRPPTGVVATTQTCPKSAPPGGPFVAGSFASLARRSVTMSGQAAEQVTSGGGDPATAKALNPLSQPLCNPLPSRSSASAGVAVYEMPVGSNPLTLVGSVSVRATLAVRGSYPELVARLWDVAPGGTRQIVAMGVYRPSTGATPSAVGSGAPAGAGERVSFDLWPNAYTFAPGHTVELELLGSNAPFLRKSNGTFTITVSGLSARLPVR